MNEQSCDFDKKECCYKTRDQNIKLEERGKKAVLVNKSRRSFVVVEVDGCAVNSGPRADYMLKSATPSRAVIVELKGRDVEHAFEQISATFALAREQMAGTDLSALIVCSECPSISSVIQQRQEKFRRAFHGRSVKISSGSKFVGEFEAFFAPASADLKKRHKPASPARQPRRRSTTNS